MNLEVYADSFERGMNLMGVYYTKTAAHPSPLVVAIPSFPGAIPETPIMPGIPGMRVTVVPDDQEEKKKKSSTNTALRYLPVLALAALGIMLGPSLWRALTGRGQSDKQRSSGQVSERPPALADVHDRLLSMYGPTVKEVWFPWATSLAAAQGFRGVADAYDRLF